MTWTCSKCGKVMLTEEEYKRHVCFGTGQIIKKCLRCNGTGKVASIGPTYECPVCHGSGHIVE